MHFAAVDLQRVLTGRDLDHVDVIDPRGRLQAPAVVELPGLKVALDDLVIRLLERPVVGAGQRQSDHRHVVVIAVEADRSRQCQHLMQPDHIERMPREHLVLARVAGQRRIDFTKPVVWIALGVEYPDYAVIRNE